MAVDRARGRRRIGEAFPWGTLLVNAPGSWIIGLFAALTAPGGSLAAEPTTRELVIVGPCGGYTTFSSPQPADAN
jgi:CrcB protein